MNALAAAWLILTLFFTEIVLGSVIVAAFTALTSSGALRRLGGGVAQSLRLAEPLFVLFAVLLAIFPAVADRGPDGSFRAQYLSPAALIARTALLAVVWSSFARGLRRAPRELIAAPALIATLLIATVIATDWIASLAGRWHSSVLGLLFAVSCTLTAFAYRLRRLPPDATDDDLRRLNNIHFSLIGAWAYLNVCQFVVIWSGNVPDEASWFVARLQTSWAPLTSVLVLGQFAGPFVPLLFRRAKRNAVFTRALGGTTLTLQILYLTWLVLPSLRPAGALITIADLLAVILLAGLAAGTAKEVAW